MVILYIQYLYVDCTEWHNFCHRIYMFVNSILNVSPMEILNTLLLSNYAQEQGERVAKKTLKREPQE